MPGKPEIRGEVFSSKFGGKKETNVASGEFEAKPADPAGDKRRMDKILAKQRAKDKNKSPR